MLNVYEELGEASRRLILGELRSGPKKVSDLVASTKLRQPNVSNHLARLRAKEIVRAAKLGREVYYSIASPEIEAIVNSLFGSQIGEAEDLDFQELAKQYAKAATRGDENACAEILDTAFRGQASILAIYQDLLSPAMHLVGSWYEVSAIDEAQEHIASNITDHMMGRAVQMSSPLKKHHKSVVLGCAAQNWHVIGIRMLSDYLKLSGWTTYFLGANTPTESFVNTVIDRQPNLVMLSCASDEGEASTIELLQRLSGSRTRKLQFLIGVGGSRVNRDPELFLDSGADFTSTDLKDFSENYLHDIETTGSVAKRRARSESDVNLKVAAK